MIYFHNPGLIPIEGFTVLGVNAKANDGAIGHFGTGLKIAIASILRLGGEISIHRGNDAYVFDTSEREIRGKTFNVVVYSKNGGPPVDLAYTTELGKNWEPWMLVRELESNCRDEGGVSGFGKVLVSPEDTCIFVRSSIIEAEYLKMDEFFLTTEPVYKDARVEYHPVEEPTADFFYRGIRVGRLTHPVPFRLNFIGMNLQRYLAEDRSMPYYAVYPALCSSICQMEDKYMLTTLFPHKIDPEALMYKIDFGLGSGIASPFFLDFMHKKHREDVLSVPHSIVRILIDSGILGKGALRPVIDMTEIEQQQIMTARQFLTDFGLDGNKYEIYKSELGGNVYGMADIVDRIILISPLAFMMGTKFVCSTVLEEHLHLQYGYKDCTRELQNYLFEKVVSLMEQFHYKKPL